MTFEELALADRDIIRALEQTATSRPSPAVPGQFTYPFHVRRNAELAALRLRQLLEVDDDDDALPDTNDGEDYAHRSEPAVGSPVLDEVHADEHPPPRDHWRSQMLSPFGRTARALDRLLLAMGHFVAVFGVGIEEDPEAAGWIVTHVDGGRFLLTMRELPPEEVTRLLVGDLGDVD